MKNKSIQIKKLNSQLNPILIDEIGKKKSIKKRKKNESIRLTRDLDHETWTTQ
jgi:hypothetical protein